VHAAGLAQLKVKMLEHQRQLFADGQHGRQPEGPDMAVADKPAFQQHAVGRDERCSRGLGEAKELFVSDVRVPLGLVAGGAEPAC